jgi:hypothetical protein
MSVDHCWLAHTREQREEREESIDTPTLVVWQGSLEWLDVQNPGKQGRGLVSGKQSLDDCDLPDRHYLQEIEGVEGVLWREWRRNSAGDEGVWLVAKEQKAMSHELG